MNEEERLVKILQLSHSQVLAGKSYSQEEAERFLDDRLRSGSPLTGGKTVHLCDALKQAILRQEFE